jgi:septum formation inhibitor-activating ATPase MinD
LVSIDNEDAVSLDTKAYRENLEVLIGIIDRKIHRAIELDQLVVLTAELLKDKLDEAQVILPASVGEDLESIASKSGENGDILRQIRAIVNEELLKMSKPQ